MSLCPGGLHKWVLESEPQSLSCPGPPNWCYLLPDHAHGHGHRLLCSDPAGALGSAQRTPLRVGASLPGSGHHGPRGHSLHFSVLHGQALGWGGMPQDPCLCQKWLFLLPWIPLLSQPRERGGRPALCRTTSVSALLPPFRSSALLCFPQTPFCRAKGIVEIK